MNHQNIIIYESDDGTASINVKLEKETVWLTQKQIAKLFGVKSQNITMHLKNIYTEGELIQESTCKEFLQVQTEGKRKVERKAKFYNLDAIISVGYRIKSQIATQFRIWASKVLKEHLIKGYTVNENRLLELKQSINIVNNVIANYEISTDETKALFKVIAEYSYALDILDDYDYQRVIISGTSKKKVNELDYKEAKKIIENLKVKFGASIFFGKEKDKSFEGSLCTIYQSFGGQELYPSLEEKAANLLYFLVKNHPFVDGNKRIAACLFIWFLEKNNILVNKKGNRKIANNTLVAITLMIAESKPEERETIVKVVINLINNKN